jgi:hypothetical protein
MNIRLARPPTATSAPQFADDVTRWVRKRFAVELDYSVGSLQAVDELLGKMHAQNVALDKVGETLWCLGCYVGEVFVRNADAVWKDDELPPVAKDSGAIWLARGERWINPIGKVVKRAANAGDGDLLAFYLTFTRDEA